MLRMTRLLIKASGSVYFYTGDQQLKEYEMIKNIELGKKLKF